MLVLLNRARGMFDDSRSFVSRDFLRGVFDIEFKAYLADTDARVRELLERWAQRRKRKETTDSASFTNLFFSELWGYRDADVADRADVTMEREYAVKGGGPKGGIGFADLALARFGERDPVPQVLCEFKDVKSGLDVRQARKNAQRTPAEQCLDYVKAARKGLYGSEPVMPWWGLVSDMNEFRLYWWDRAPDRYLRFVVEGADLLGHDLISDGEAAQFDRFLFWRLFQPDQLLSPGGKPALLRLIERQWVKERALEEEFYEHYNGLRNRLFNCLITQNPQYIDRKVHLLNLAQKLLDRFIFAFYCEDMGARMLFPPQFIRDYLRQRSIEPFYDPNGHEIWTFFKQLFGRMNDGGKLGRTDVPQINGGLFKPDEEIEALTLTNDVFAAPEQGAGRDAKLEVDTRTVLYLSARYNYASGSADGDSLSLYTLGRIFEQSLTELEYKTGEFEDRESFASLAKRKRDGVYYTPERVVTYLVRETLGPWMVQARRECGLTHDDTTPPTREALDAYRQRLKAVRIVDPACGSGAFLIAAFRQLLDERKKVDREIFVLEGGAVRAPEEARIISEILESNLYGVDLNAAAVEIAKLALWLHSARADAPLSSLDHTLRCFNSLIEPDFWRGRIDDSDLRERVRAETTWRDAFPEVFDGGKAGFDVVIGNPPYVKLQDQRKLDSVMADYVQADRGQQTYRSAQTGNFDLYLPFIELGLRLLAPGGRMAYIAPSLWPRNKYGEGLRRLVHEGRHLERWLDFKAFQIFEDVTTYTALQFFTRDANDTMRIAAAPDGAMESIDWSDPALAVPYDTMPEEGEWLMATGAARALIRRLEKTCLRLDDPKVTKAITVGIQTSADYIYHLRKVGRGRYQCKPKEGAPYIVDIEDEIMRPLISGAEAKRFEAPETKTYILFPYERDESGRMRLIRQSELTAQYPMAWAYLKSWEEDLRKREKHKFDAAEWYQFGRSQNIGKQDIQKLIVAQTVPGLRVSSDTDGYFYLNNVRVNGIIPAKNRSGLALLAAMNGSIAEFVFQRIGKPKRGGYLEANRQFIAPLPIPTFTAEDEVALAGFGERLQDACTRRRNLMQQTAERASVLAVKSERETFLWPDLEDHKSLEDRAPAALRLAADRRKWADVQRDEAVDARLAVLQGAMDRGGDFSAQYKDGELRLAADGATLLDRVYLDEREGWLCQAWWRYLIESGLPRDANTFANKLRRRPSEPDAPAARQFLERVNELVTLVTEIEAEEHALSEILYDLYALTREERQLVEKG